VGVSGQHFIANFVQSGTSKRVLNLSIFGEECACGVLVFNASYRRWPNKNGTFLRYHIFAANTDIGPNHVVFAEVFRNYNRKQNNKRIFLKC